MLVGRIETFSAKDHVIPLHRNDFCRFWFDPPIQALAKRHLLIPKAFEQRSDFCRLFDCAGMEEAQLVG